MISGLGVRPIKRREFIKLLGAERFRAVLSKFTIRGPLWGRRDQRTQARRVTILRVK